MTGQVVRWRRLDPPGEDTACLLQSEAGWTLSGSATFEEASGPARLAYRIACDAAWNTLSAEVVGTANGAPVQIRIDVRDERWFLNDEERPDCEGCLDVDLNFTPATNLLPIRRLDLAIGDSKKVRAAWLAPSFELEPLDQIYAREAETTYRYESDGGSFVRTLTTNASGFVVDYPGLWTLAEPRKR